MEVIENKGANLQEDLGADWWLRVVRSIGGAGHVLDLSSWLLL